MSALLNAAWMTTATTGTGTVTLGSALLGYLTFSEAGAVNATVYAYRINDGNNFEIGQGTYTSSGTTFSRDTVTVSKIGGTAGTSKINLSGSATVMITARVADLLLASNAPLVIGGSGTTGTQLTLQTTSANGTTDALAVVGGNNGATPFGTLSAVKLDLPQATASSSTTTGALTVAGGIGAGGDVYARQFYGAYNQNAQSYFQIINTNTGGSAAATLNASSANGACAISASYAGYSNLSVTSPSGLYVDATGASSFVQFRIQAGFTSSLKIGVTAVEVQLATASTDYTNGALTVAGGLGVSGSIFASGNVCFRPGASVTPASNGDVTFELTSNTSLKIKAKGSDGVVRSVTLTLA